MRRSGRRKAGAGASAIPSREPAKVISMSDLEYREFPCDICGNSDPVEVPHSRDYTEGQPVHICRRCGFVYVVRRRSAERIADVWSTEIFGGTYTAAIPAVAARLTYVAEFVETTIGLKGKTVAEIGAGEGRFLALARDHYGAEVFGVEPSIANSRLMKTAGIAHATGTIEAYLDRSDARAGAFDLVLVLWTLENCQDCKGLLRGAHRLLKPGGSVVVATGSRILVPFKKPLHTYLSAIPADACAFRFSANTLRGVLALSGFDPRHINRFIDHDILCVIGKRVDDGSPKTWSGDNYLDVYSFFERWHVDTQMYFPDPVV
jgi:SAM-dependent methyltransferase